MQLQSMLHLCCVYAPANALGAEPLKGAGNVAVMPVLALKARITPGAQLAHANDLIVGEQASSDQAPQFALPRKACIK